MRQYIAKPGMAWKNIKSGAVIGKTVTLKDGETISSYTQVKKTTSLAAKQSGKTKNIAPHSSGAESEIN